MSDTSCEACDRVLRLLLSGKHSDGWTTPELHEELSIPQETIRYHLKTHLKRAGLAQDIIVTRKDRRVPGWKATFNKEFGMGYKDETGKLHPFPPPEGLGLVVWGTKITSEIASSEEQASKETV